MSYEPSVVNDGRRHVMNDKLVHLMAELKEKETIEMVKQLVSGGTHPMEILDGAEEVRISEKRPTSFCPL
jgi:hypothetical protein